MHIAKLSKRIKGALEVVALVDTRMGTNDQVVPAGTIGYVHAQKVDENRYIIEWRIPKRHRYDWRTSVHSMDDVAPTGNRG